MGENLEKEDQNFPSSSSASIEKPSIRQAIEDLSSLISLSHSIKVFTVKWQTIRTKLEDLNSGLIAVENCDSCENSNLSTLVSSILDTVNESQDLARRCLDLSYSGKLLMQSDLDVISSKFDLHVKNLTGVYQTGVLSHRFALVVSKPGLSPCKDDMRFYLRDLLTRMKIGDIEMKKQGLENLYQVMDEDERYVKLVVNEVHEILNLLVNFLDSMDKEIQGKAAGVVYIISGFYLYRSALVGVGVIGPVIRVLETGHGTGQEYGAKILQKLTENCDNAWSVSAYGGVTALLNICSSSSSSSSGDQCSVELIGAACGILRNLVGVDEIKRFMVEDGAISTFIKLIRSKDEVVQINSIDFIQSMASGDEQIKQMVIKEGGVRVLVHVLDPKSSFSSKTRETSLRCIEKLCFNSSERINILISYGFMEELVYLLGKGEVLIQELSLKLSLKLCDTSDEIKKKMGEVGFMDEFLKLLDAKSFEVREMAAEGISKVVSIPRNRRRFVEDDRNIGVIMQLLDQEKEGSNCNNSNSNSNSGNYKKLLISILMSLTSCNSGRKKIANSGYLKNIEKLAEAEVSDAKRLVRKLSGNRFRSMISGIWHS